LTELFMKISLMQLKENLKMKN